MIITLVPINLADNSSQIYSSDDCQLIIKMWKEYYPKIGYNFPWIGYFIKREDQIVGSCGFTGPPFNNRVEVAYTTFKGFEGQGIASLACKQLISIVKNTDSGLIITAKTAPENNTSTSILKRNGFVYSGIVQDHEIGDAWEWVLLNNE